MVDALRDAGVRQLHAMVPTLAFNSPTKPSDHPCRPQGIWPRRGVRWTTAAITRTDSCLRGHGDGLTAGRAI